MASSPLSPREPVIGDGTPDGHDALTGGARGLDLSARAGAGVAAYEGAAEAFPAALLVPKSEWQARIQERDAAKTRLSDLCTQAGLKCKDQGRTNYCWVNSPTYCVEVVRCVQNQPPVTLSAASAGGPIKNFWNVGGWGKEALDWIGAHGLVPEAEWPANDISKKYYTDANKTLALRYRQDEWWALDYTSLDQIVSCLLRGVPVSAGYSWWSHQVTLIDPVWVDGAVGVRFRNSWGMGYGDQGYGVLQGRKMMPDDACAPRTAYAS